MRRQRCTAAALAGATIALLLTAAPEVSAQVPLPGPAQPGQLQERFRPQPQLPEERPLPSPAPPTTSVPGDETVRFQVTEILLEGVSAYRAGELRPLYADLIGTEATLAQISALADRLTARYRADGYILSQVVVPEQRIEQGVVRLQAVEGFIDRVILEGEVAGNRQLLEAFAARMRDVRPLTAGALERNLLLIGDLPGVNVQGVLEPSPTTFGAADLRVVLRHTPAEAFAVLDNRGSRFVGPWTATIGGSAHSPLGFYEQFDLLAAFSPDSGEFGYLQGQLTVPLGAAAPGDSVQLFAAFGRIRPDIPTNIFPFENEAHSFEGRVTYFRPWLRSRSSNFATRASFIWRDVDTRITDLPEDGGNPTDDRVRVLQLRGTYDMTDRIGGVSLIDFAINQGLDIFGASNRGENTSRQTGEGTFTYANLTLSRQQYLAPKWSLYGEVLGQYSFDPLLPTERIGIGGTRFGRGFPPGNATGDHGMAAKFELRYGDVAGLAVLESYQVYGFVDAGRTWDTGDPPRVRDELVSAGLGARLNITDRVSFNPELTRQLVGEPGDRPGRRHETRLLFSLVARF
jgi:hemolysin activation/secretion protein